MLCKQSGVGLDNTQASSNARQKAFQVDRSAQKTYHCNQHNWVSGQNPRQRRELRHGISQGLPDIGSRLAETAVDVPSKHSESTPKLIQALADATG